MISCESQVPPKTGDTRYAEIKAVENKMARSIFQTCHSMKAVASKENQMRFDAQGLQDCAEARKYCLWNPQV
jgi:hypothetical protein